MPSAITVSDIRKVYGETRAVDGVSFEVADGEFFGILGPNGAGKTTTLEIIEGLRKADSGAVTLLGASPWPRNSALLPRIGVQLQASSFFERLTAREQIRTWAALYGVGPAKADEMLEIVGLSRQGEHPDPEALRWPGTAALHRLRARPRTRRRVPRRADLRTRPAGPAQSVGPAPRHQQAGPHGRAHHSLHGRGRAALRPGRHHGPRQDPQDRTAGGTGPRPGRAHPHLCREWSDHRGGRAIARQ